MTRQKIKRNILFLMLAVIAIGILPGCDWFKTKKTDAPIPERGLRHVDLGRTFDQPAVTIAGPVKNERFDDLEITELVAKDRVGHLFPLDVSFGRNEFGPWLRISTPATKAYKELTIWAKIRYQRKDYNLQASFEKKEGEKAWQRQNVIFMPK